MASAGRRDRARAYPAYATQADLGRSAAGIVLMWRQTEKAQLHGMGERRKAAAGSLFYAFAHVAEALGLK